MANTSKKSGMDTYKFLIHKPKVSRNLLFMTTWEEQMLKRQSLLWDKVPMVHIKYKDVKGTE